MMDVVPSVTAAKGHQARKRLQIKLKESYGSGGDLHNDAAGITKGRAAFLRKLGIEPSSVGTLELTLMHVATTNTIPRLFWFVGYILIRPNLIARLRDEAEAMVAGQDGQDEVTVYVDVLQSSARCSAAATAK